MELRVVKSSWFSFKFTVKCLTKHLCSDIMYYTFTHKDCEGNNNHIQQITESRRLVRGGIEDMLYSSRSRFTKGFAE